MFRTLLIVALGGGIGSALRYAVSKFVQDNMSGAFPYHTFAVNIVGCLLIGLRTRCTRTPWQQHHNAAAYHRLVRRLHHVLHVLQREHRALAWRQRFRRPTLHRQ